MTEGARLLTLRLPSVLTARETLERRLGTGRVAAEPEAVEKIIQLCGRLPLALAIVSARAAAHPDFTLASIAADLQRTQGRLDAFGAAGLDADARTVFSWSYHLLSPQACRLFRMLSLLPTTDITAAASCQPARRPNRSGGPADSRADQHLPDHRTPAWAVLLSRIDPFLCFGAVGKHRYQHRTTGGLGPSARSLRAFELCCPGKTETAS
jgi:hypothetical protein